MTASIVAASYMSNEKPGQLCEKQSWPGVTSSSAPLFTMEGTQVSQRTLSVQQP